MALTPPPYRAEPVCRCTTSDGRVLKGKLSEILEGGDDGGGQLLSFGESQSPVFGEFASLANIG